MKMLRVSWWAASLLAHRNNKQETTEEAHPLSGEKEARLSPTIGYYSGSGKGGAEWSALPSAGDINRGGWFTQKHIWAVYSLSVRALSPSLL